jgi:trehalose 6-phosphate synthase
MWIFSANSEEDRKVAEAHPLGHEEADQRVRIIGIPPDVERAHYEIASLQLLLPLFHYLLRLTTEPTFDEAFARAWSGYRHVNARFAEAILDSQPGGPVLVQDYHLMLVANDIFRRSPNFPPRLHYFHHVPWCEPDYLSFLPRTLREELLLALLRFDVVAFHTRRWSDAFLRCCDRFLPDARSEDGAVIWRGRRIPVIACPAPVDTERIGALAHDRVTDQWADEFERLRAGRWVLLKVERADLWKNLARGFLAYESLVRRRPALAERIWFLAILSRPRVETNEQIRYLDEALAIAKRTNDSFRAATSQSCDPVTVLITDTPERTEPFRALAAMRVADAALVNPIIDGLNLVSKETVVVSPRDAVLILSRNAGAFEELRDWVLDVDPTDVSGTASAIEQAFAMQQEDRARRARLLRKQITSRTLEDWLADQLEAR